jgi:7,8-dihydropterin-6-yl-methyl-4-(beta-D-ribofuranosyl)aminobenzene 5'-phosphate synthase
MNKIKFGQVDHAEITILVDNRADMITKSAGTVKRFGGGPLLAEHGLAMLIQFPGSGHTVLWDSGCTRGAMLENMKRMGIDPAAIKAIALSHGHGDHTGGMTDLLLAASAYSHGRRWDQGLSLQEILALREQSRIPLVAHPAAFRERWNVGKDGVIRGPSQPPLQEEWKAAGAKLVLTGEPTQLGEGCWTTGEVPRVTFEQVSAAATRFYRDGDMLKPDALEDDQAIVINVKDKGLVVVAGCAHAGIINTVRRAREISGVEKVWAVLGGFHLAGAKEEVIEQTIDHMIEIDPVCISPMHCTGLEAICRFEQRMPDQFVQGLVGTQYLF